MDTIFLFQKPNYKRGYYTIKRLCKEEGINFELLPEGVKKGIIGFIMGSVIISILEVDNRI